MTKLNDTSVSLHQAKSDYSSVIRAFCSIYFSSFVVETETDTYQCLDRPAWMMQLPMEGNCGELIEAVVNGVVLPEFRDSTRAFLNREHIASMMDRKNITELKKSFYLDVKAMREGQSYWCRISLILMESLPDGKPKRILIVLQDVTREKAGEEKTRDDMAQQLEIVNALSRDYLNVYLIDPAMTELQILKLNGYVTEGLDRESKETYQYYPHCLTYIEKRVHPDDHEMMKRAMHPETVLENLDRKGEYVSSYRVLSEGETHYFQFKYIRIGKSDMIIAAFQNVDESVATEKRHREDLQNALENARKANLAKTVFLNNMSHDIRTPMNAIIGYTALASSHMDDPERLRDYLAKITSSSEHLLSLINDVLDMSRIESGKLQLVEKGCSLAKVMHDLRDILQSDIRRHQLSFMIDTVDVINENVICDKLRLSQVLLNCTSNAIKFTPPGG